MPCRHADGVDLRRLECFLAVVDAGTVTAAAHRLRLAQPALSRQLRNLERELGITLFDRAQNRLQLTPAGREFVPMARALLVRARDLAGGVVQRLLLAAPTATVSELVAPFLATLNSSDPFVLVREVSPELAYASLQSGADLAISPAPVTGSVNHLSLGAVPLRAYVSPLHRWASRPGRTVQLDELVEQRLILLPPNNSSRAELDLAVARNGLSYGEVEECDVARAVQAHAAAGRGVGVVTDLPRFGAHSSFISEPFPASGTPLHLTLHAAWDPQHFAVTTVAELASRVRSHLQAAAVTVG